MTLPLLFTQATGTTDKVRRCVLAHDSLDCLRTAGFYLAGECPSNAASEPSFPATTGNRSSIEIRPTSSRNVAIGHDTHRHERVTLLLDDDERSDMALAHLACRFSQRFIRSHAIHFTTAQLPSALVGLISTDDLLAEVAADRSGHKFLDQSGATPRV
jgi:hypothetical protein